MQGTAIKARFYLNLAQHIVSGGKPSEKISKIKAINFNYDHCIEKFSSDAQDIYFNNNTENILPNVPIPPLCILRPYGELKGDFTVGNSDRVQKIEYTYEKAVEASKNITTFSEPANEITKLQVRTVLSEAQSIIFLGFAFHPQNMEYLDPRHAGLMNSKRPKIFATAYGMSAPAALQIKRELTEMFNAFPDDVHVRNDLTRAKLMEEYGRPPYQYIAIPSNQ